jgi:hypothetical protein
LALAISLTGVFTASRMNTVIWAVNIRVATMPTDKMPTIRRRSAPAAKDSKEGVFQRDEAATYTLPMEPKKACTTAASSEAGTVLSDLLSQTKTCHQHRPPVTAMVIGAHLRAESMTLPLFCKHPRCCRQQHSPMLATSSSNSRPLSGNNSRYHQMRNITSSAKFGC